MGSREIIQGYYTAVWGYRQNTPKVLTVVPILKNMQDTHLGGCQNYGPFLGTLNIRCRIKIGIQKGTMILTTTHFWAFLIGFLGDLRSRKTC